MSERLVFGYGTSGHAGRAPSRGAVRLAGDAPPAQGVPVADVAVPRERRDWAFIGLMAFTALLYFRPQDQIPGLGALHLAEIAALGGLLSMGLGRLNRGLTVTRMTPELAGVIALGGIILATAPFGIWTGGSIATFTDMYLKVILIFLLMVNTLRSPKRIEQFTFLIVIATGYLAGRAVFDFLRGINLVENGRVQGSVGGMFRNPNDLALNMVAIFPLAIGLAMQKRPALHRLIAVGCGLLMVAAIIASHSRSGSVGLAVMALVLGATFVRRHPGLVVGGAAAIVLSLPLLPASYWHRLSSITDETQDDTGSRSARTELLKESFAAFRAHPLTGVGAGQFKNYNPGDRQEAWRESHNVLLQVAAELGIAGLLTFGFLVVRGGLAGVQARRLLRRGSNVTRDEIERMRIHSLATTAALAGWFACALFASVAYNWTFYYLLALAAAPRELLLDRRFARGATAARPQSATDPHLRPEAASV